MNEKTAFRKQVLLSLGASNDAVTELSAYNRNRFQRAENTEVRSVPLPDEPFVPVWEAYVRESAKKGVFEALKARLVQLNFPVKTGISLTDDYRAATRKGKPLADMARATGLVLEKPEDLDLHLYQSPAGRIPIIISGSRADFESLLRAFIKRNEPEPIPESMGAMMISGYNNWDRIHRYRKNWEEKTGTAAAEDAWKAVFRALIPRKDLYQDRFIILSDGPYSGIAHGKMAMYETEWRAVSLKIRCAHEWVHYLTRRVYGVMSNNLYDEIMADYAGITEVIGRYRADWFLRFMGLNDVPGDQSGGRIDNYRGDPPLVEEAFNLLKVLVKRAAENLERADTALFTNGRGAEDTVKMIFALAELTLEELASDKGTRYLMDSFYVQTDVSFIIADA